MHTNGSRLIVPRCNIVQFESDLPTPAILCRDVFQVDATDPVEAQILDFLEGRTHGEALLHALHDYVLDEPIPERMRALFRPGSAD